MSDIDFAGLRDAAQLARSRAYAPYSNFGVGAALLCESGAVVLGCNVENAAYPAGMCAERAAISAAIASGERGFRAMVVIADSALPISPCGICRQVLHELAPDMPVLLTNVAGVSIETTPRALLPGGFDNDYLLHRQPEKPV